MKFSFARFFQKMSASSAFRMMARSFREGSVQLWRNKFLSGSTILLGAMILILLNFVFAIQFYADYSLRDLESRADFSVPLQQNFDSFQFDALKNDLKKYELLIEFFPAQNFDDFLASPRLHVRFKHLEDVEPVLEVFKNHRYTEVVGDWDMVGERDFVSVTGKLLDLRRNIEHAALVMVVLFLVGGVLLVMNTFRIVVFSRRNEIYISRLVGADPGFIVGPFVAEGALMGIVSSMVAIILFVILLKQISVLPGGEVFLYFWNEIFSWEILLAGIVGGIGAWFSVKKYLFGSLTHRS